jgi:hypothetical protein
VLGDALLDRNFGPLDNDRQQNLSVSGRVAIPRTGGMIASGVYRWMTGVPITLYSSAVDADRNGRLFDPIPAGNYCGVGANPFCTENKGGRNGGRGPSYNQTDMRFGYRFRPGGTRTLDANFELFNIFDTANFANPTSDQRLTDFLVLTALRGGNGQPRAAQVGVRVGFGEGRRVGRAGEVRPARVSLGRDRVVCEIGRTPEGEQSWGARSIVSLTPAARSM